MDSANTPRPAGGVAASPSDASGRLSALLEATGGLTFVADATGGRPRPLRPSETAVAGISLSQLGTLTDLVHADQRASAISEWSTAMSRRAPLTTEWRLAVADPDPRLARIRVAPVLNDDGSMREWIGLIVEITEVRRAATEIRREKEFAASVIAASRDGILAFDRQGRTVKWNAALERLAHAAGHRVAEEPWHALFPFVQPATLLARCADMFEDGEPFIHHESIGMAGLGMERMLEFSFSPVRDAVGVISGSLCQVRDVTERQLLDTRLRQTAKMDALGVLAAGIAHDFNNTLAAMLGLAELARMDVPRTSPAYDVLGELLGSGARARDLVRQILTFSRQERPARESIDLRDIVEEATRLLRTLIPTSIEMRVRMGEAPLVVAADATQLQQVLVNLCTNAEHAMRGKGNGVIEIGATRVELSADLARAHPGLRAGPHIKLTIRDTGAGMSADVLERIFDPFFTTKPAREGTGMGLSVVHGVVTAHHGAINVHSIVGEGTVFTVLLPSVNAPLTIGPGNEDGDLTATGVVYIVDDEPTIAKLMATGLSRYGFRTRSFDSAKSLLAAFDEAPDLVHAVVSDVVMPGMSGEVLSQRLLSARPDLVVLLLSGSAPRLELALKMSGVAECLLKPVGFRTLARALARHLAARRKGELVTTGEMHVA